MASAAFVAGHRRFHRSALLRAVGANPADVRRVAARAVEQLPSARGASIAEPSLSREFVNAIGEADLIAKPLGDEYVSTEHLLAGLARVGGGVGQALRTSAPPRRAWSRRSPRCAAATAG